MQAADHHVVPDIKFSVFVEHGPLDVLLDYVGFVASVLVFLFSLQDGVEFTDLVDHSDAVAPVGEFSRFDNPYISRGSSKHSVVFL